MSALRRNVFFVLLAAASFGLAACENTIRGAGKDVSQTSDAVEDAVKAQ